MYQLIQLADDLHHQRLAYAGQQRPAGRLLTPGRTGRAGRAGRRMRRAQLEVQATHAQ